MQKSPLHLPTPVALACLRALKTVALADGEYSHYEQRLLRAAKEALGLSLDSEELEPISAEDFASKVADEHTRLRLVQAQMIMSLMDGEVSKSELAVVRQFAKVCNVSEPRLANLRQVMSGHTTWVKYDLMRKSRMMSDISKSAFEKKGLLGVWNVFAPFRGMAEDRDLAWRYKQLGLLPEGTFGRAYWQHMTERQFPFPGEHKGFPEGLVKHDLAHVLAGYDTDAQGESQVVAFICGFMKADPFWYMFMVALHTHLGIETFDGDPTFVNEFKPELVIAALERGSRVNQDLYDVSWDYWPDFPLPLAEVRRKYNVCPPQA